MKGIVFNLFEEVVRRERGEDVWDDLLGRASIDGAFTSLGSYPDAEMAGLVFAMAAVSGQSEADVLRWFGREAMGLLAVRYPGFFQVAGGTRAFLLTLNDIIHPEVRKLHPGADVPVFDFELTEAGGLRMGYQSSRRLCHLAEGFIEGAAQWFHERADVEQSSCVHRGDTRCVIDVRLSPEGAAS